MNPLLSIDIKEKYFVYSHRGVTWHLKNKNKCQNFHSKFNIGTNALEGDINQSLFQQE